MVLVNIGCTFHTHSDDNTNTNMCDVCKKFNLSLNSNKRVQEINYILEKNCICMNLCSHFCVQNPQEVIKRGKMVYTVRMH